MGNWKEVAKFAIAVAAAVGATVAPLPPALRPIIAALAAMLAGRSDAITKPPDDETAPLRR